MVHEFQLVQILLAIYQLVQSVLEAVTTLLNSHLFLILHCFLGFFELGLKIVNLMLLVLLLLQDDFLLLFHKVTLLVEYPLDPLVNAVLHFTSLHSLILLIVLH